MEFTIFCEAPDGRECEVSKEEVAACDDVELLREWLDIFETCKDEAKPELRFYGEFGGIPQGLEYKYKKWSQAIHWIEKRIKQLTATDTETELRNLVEKLNAAVSKRNGRILYLEALCQENGIEV